MRRLLVVALILLSTESISAQLVYTLNTDPTQFTLVSNLAVTTYLPAGVQLNVVSLNNMSVSSVQVFIGQPVYNPNGTSGVFLLNPAAVTIVGNSILFDTPNITLSSFYSVAILINDTIRDVYKMNIGNTLSLETESNTNVSTIFAYPNPTTENLTLSFEANEVQAAISIYALSGNLISVNNENRIIGENQVLLHTSELNQGIYFVKVGEKMLRFVKE
jgi:hypothetical protein